MNALALRLVALVGAFLLALPAGWCGQLPGPADAAQPAQASCCHPGGLPAHAPGHSSCPSSPTQGATQCCCSQPNIAPEKVVSDADLRSIGTVHLATAAILDSDRAAGIFPLEPASPRLSAGLRLHALLSVWRC